MVYISNVWLTATGSGGSVKETFVDADKGNATELHLVLCSLVVARKVDCAGLPSQNVVDIGR